jgi:gluconate kinase
MKNCAINLVAWIDTDKIYLFNEYAKIDQSHPLTDTDLKKLFKI